MTFVTLKPKSGSIGTMANSVTYVSKAEAKSRNRWQGRDGKRWKTCRASAGKLHKQLSIGFGLAPNDLIGQDMFHKIWGLIRCYLRLFM